jgi:hypothetical protein
MARAEGLLAGWLIGLCAGLAIASVHAQVRTPQPAVCFGTVDTSESVATGSRRYVFTGLDCPMRGTWVIAEMPQDHALVIVGKLVLDDQGR